MYSDRWFLFTKFVVVFFSLVDLYGAVVWFNDDGPLLTAAVLMRQQLKWQVHYFLIR